MKIKSFSRRDWTVLFILLAILGLAAAVFGTRGVFVGIILLYVNASVDVLRQIKDRFINGQVQNAISNLLAFCIISVVVISVFFRLLW
jgi:hypothetical protein